MDTEFWRGKRVFITGHTGFKGGWLSLWLQQLGAEVHGYALAAPTQPSLFVEARVARGMSSTIGDIRDEAALRRALVAVSPDVVFHLAAQPLVRASYADPVGTYATNVMGTVHLLEAVRQCAGVRVVVNVTTDKCYENGERATAFREGDPMGGHDPYSSSKGCAELLSSAWRRSFLREAGIALATARAGNVIGGGDWAEDRLVPDLLRHFERGETVAIRNPHAVRPWQHVLEPLSGYLTLAHAMWDDPHGVGGGWNFGPDADDARPVQWIVERMATLWGRGAHWAVDDAAQPHEAQHLTLDCTKARERLGWQPRWRLDESLRRIVAWHRAWREGQDMREACLREIESFQPARHPAEAA